MPLIGLELKLLPRVSIPCWSSVQSSIKLAYCVLPVAVLQSIVCAICRVNAYGGNMDDQEENQRVKVQENLEC